MKRILIFVFLIALCTGWAEKLQAQRTDFGSWLSFEISKELFKRFDLEFEEEVRIIRNFGEIKRISTSLGFAWSLNKHVKGGAGYAWLVRHDINDSYWENRHRVYLFLTGRMDIGRFTFSLRERFQSTYPDENAPGFDYSPENHLRSRLQVAWDLKGKKAEPYASAEMHYQLNNPDGNKMDNMRYTLGVDFPLSKKLDLDTYLRFDQEMNVKKPDHLYLVGVTLKWGM